MLGIEVSVARCFAIAQATPQTTDSDFDALGSTSIGLFIIAFLFCFLIMLAVLWIGWWFTNRQGSVSPYTGHNMFVGENLAYSAVESIQRFFEKMDDPDNPVFDLQYAAICRETGRVFPDGVNRFGVVTVGWEFLKQRYTGEWVSWGSLSYEEKLVIRHCHDTLEGYQTMESCSSPKPQDVDTYHVTLKPGPLYVDKRTWTLLGWQRVTDTDLEVLVVQRPYRLPDAAERDAIATQ